MSVLYIEMYTFRDPQITAADILCFGLHVSAMSTDIIEDAEKGIAAAEEFRDGTGKDGVLGFSAGGGMYHGDLWSCDGLLL